MLPSIEVRWFVEGALPEAITGWYEDAVGLLDWDERTDRYIRPVAPDGMNVKWREGHIEIKRRSDVIGPSTWGRVSGSVERWRKWSFPIAEEMPLAATGKEWIPVIKHRSVRSFTIKNEKLVLTKPGEHLAHGCSVELAEVTVHHEPWWTLCLEAFGPDAEARTLIQQVGDRIFEDDNSPDLTEQSSMSYVRWLARDDDSG